MANKHTPKTTPICPYCRTRPINKWPGAKTCGNKDCQREHKRQVTKIHAKAYYEKTRRRKYQQYTVQKERTVYLTQEFII